ncbi:MAG: hypothetical protein OCD01_11115 [Fibrobacterales bacterium]
MESSVIAPAIEEGIQNIGTGKRCTDCTPELVDSIINEIQEGLVPKSIQGAFLGALFFKHPSSEEIRLESVGVTNCLRSSSVFINYFLNDTPVEIQGFGKSLLDKMDLSRNETRILGEYLMTTKNDFIRGFFASVLRIKYETTEEYVGLIEAVEKVDGLPESRKVTDDNVIQLAEPFDGTNRSFLLTPIIIEELNKAGFKALCMCGESAGPKFGNNLLGLGKALDRSFYMGIVKDMPIPETGLYVNQNDLFPALTKYQRIRREIKKRPFLATIEKMINPFGTKIGLFSSFHGRYSEMILDVAIEQGYSVAVGVFKGLEGGLTPSFARGVHITIAYRDAYGDVAKEKRVFTPEEFGYESVKVENLENPQADENAAFLTTYWNNPETMSSIDRNHIEYTQKVYGAVAEWIKGTL